MKIALLTTDNRDMNRDYAAYMPVFGTAPEALLQGFVGLPGVEVHVLSCTQQPMKSPATLAENIHFHSLHVPKFGWLRTGYQGCIRATRRKLREIQPDIVHGQGTERDCAISAVFSGYPNVVTIHGKMTDIAEIKRARIGSFYWCASRLENFTLPRSSGIICISTYIENLAKPYGVPLWLIPNALQRNFFDFPRTQQERKIPLLLNVGVVSERKRQRELLKILRELCTEGLDFETLFVGSSDSDSPYAIAFQGELAAAQAELGKFSYLPHRGVDEMCRLFDASAAVIHFASQETFGLVFGEALARNVYLFASDVGSIRDISEGVSGVEIFNLNDWDSLKSAVRRWLRTDAFKIPKPAASPEALVKRYHPAEVARQHLQVYREILDRAAKPKI
jgi:glycosyltransferase involved in cell wall biosynthesis